MPRIPVKAIQQQTRNISNNNDNQINTQINIRMIYIDPPAVDPPFWPPFWLRCDKSCFVCVFWCPQGCTWPCAWVCVGVVWCAFVCNASKSNKCCSWGQCPQQCCSWGQCSQQCCSWGQCSRLSLPTGALAIYQEACQWQAAINHISHTRVGDLVGVMCWTGVRWPDNITQPALAAHPSVNNPSIAPQGGKILTQHLNQIFTARAGNAEPLTLHFSYACIRNCTTETWTLKNSQFIHAPQGRQQIAPTPLSVKSSLQVQETLNHSPFLSHMHAPAIAKQNREHWTTLNLIVHAPQGRQTIDPTP